MKQDLRNIFKITSVYVAATIGAAFASGQEIMQFFTRFLKGSFLGVLLAGILFALVGYVVLDTVYRYRIDNFSSLMIRILGRFGGRVMEIAAEAYSFCVYVIMIAGAGSIIRWFFDFPAGLGIVITSIICLIIMLGDIKGVASASEILTPFMILGLIIMGVYIGFFEETSVFASLIEVRKHLDNWLVYSILYVCYNSILTTVIMCNMLPWLTSRRVGKISGILGGLFLCFVSILLNYSMFIYYHDIFSCELPMLELALRRGRLAGLLYTIILCFAMLTTAISSGYCFSERFSSWVPIDRKVIVFIVCCISVPLARMGFSQLIAVIFPIFGYAGFIMLFAIILDYVRGRVPGRHTARREE